MKKILSVLVAIFLLSACAMKENKNDMKKILPYAIHQHKLENGLNVVTVPYDSPGLAAFYIVVRAGSRDEIEPGHTGFAHFFEHMMFRGTDKYSKEKYSEILKSTGASANANTDNDRTLYHMTGDATKLETMFELEADRFMNLHYSVGDFKTEAGAVKGEYTKNSASPYVQLDEKISDAAFDKHTYKHTTMGFFKDIVDMPNQYDYSIQFFNRFYRPEYCTIIVVGDVKPEQVNDLSQKYFGSWKHGDYVSKVDAEPAQTATRYTSVVVPNFPPYLTLNYKGPAFSDTAMDMPALDVLSSILFSEKSDLYNKLVLTEQKCREIGGYALDARDPGLINISASLVDIKDMQYVKDEFVKALEAAKSTPVNDSTLAETKSHLKYSFAMSIDNPTSIAESLSHYVWLTGDPETLNHLYTLYDKVTAQDVMNVAKKYFVPTGLTVGTIVPDDKMAVK